MEIRHVDAQPPAPWVGTQPIRFCGQPALFGAPKAFSFGTTTSTTSTGFGFGSGSTNSFGSTTGSTGFGFGSGSTSAFGSNTGSSFGFGSPAPSSFGFSATTPSSTFGSTTGTFSFNQQAQQPTASLFGSSFATTTSAPTVQTTSSQNLDKLVQMQTAFGKLLFLYRKTNFLKGFWKLNDEFCKLLNVLPAVLQTAIPSVSMEVLATFIALAYLEVHFGSFKDEWSLLAQKAKNWLVKQQQPYDQNFAKAKEFVEKYVKK
jgi:hypothetical protein